jgi:hypothetical protein
MKSMELQVHWTLLKVTQCRGGITVAWQDAALFGNKYVGMPIAKKPSHSEVLGQVTSLKTNRWRSNVRR